ncbi:unnamed protein product [Spodoptera exigua]|nr:unnamed protein product [Spodoptera exigua]
MRKKTNLKVLVLMLRIILITSLSMALLTSVAVLVEVREVQELALYMVQVAATNLAVAASKLVEEPTRAVEDPSKVEVEVTEAVAVDTLTLHHRRLVDPQLKQILEKCEEKYKCEVLRCTTGRMMKGQEAWFAFRSRINASVLSEISKDRAVILSTLAAARVSRLPMVGRPTDRTWHTAEAQTLITPRLEALDSGTIPLWVVILAAIIGALLLLLLIFALYKCGFFKRNRPSDHAERQPLNGRDEHL